MKERENVNPVSTEAIPKYIKILIAKDANRTITRDESRDLVEWLSEDKSNWDLFERERKSLKLDCR